MGRHSLEAITDRGGRPVMVVRRLDAQYIIIKLTSA